MRIFLITLALFAGSMAVHFATWKARLPRQHIKALLIIFATLFFLWLALSLACQATLLSMLQVTLYYWSVCLCYTITYTAIEADSPTLSLMRFIGSAGSDGRSAEEIARFMAARPFIGARLAALIKSGLIREQSGQYVIAGKQPLAFRLIAAYRKLYGSIPKGG